MKQIKISPADLKELESAELESVGAIPNELTSRLKEALDVVKGRKLTSYGVMVSRLHTNRRCARNLLEALRERGLINKQYAFLLCSDGNKRKTAVYYEVKK
jgi:ribosomal protein S25